MRKTVEIMAAIEDRLNELETRIKSIPTREEMDTLLRAHNEENYKLKSAMDMSFRAETQRLGVIVDNLRDTIDTFTQRLEARNEQVQAIQTDVNDVEHRAGRIETTVAQHGQQIARIESEIKALRHTIHGNNDSPDSPSIFRSLGNIQRTMQGMDERSGQHHTELMSGFRENQQRIQSLEAASVERERFWKRINGAWSYLAGTWTGRMMLGVIVFTIAVMIMAMALNLSEALETMRLFAEVNGS